MDDIEDIEDIAAEAGNCGAAPTQSVAKTAAEKSDAKKRFMKFSPVVSEISRRG